MIHQACWRAWHDGERACDECEAILDAHFATPELEPGIMLDEPELEMSGAELVAEHRGETELLPDLHVIDVRACDYVTRVIFAHRYTFSSPLWDICQNDPVMFATVVKHEIADMQREMRRHGAAVPAMIWEARTLRFDA